VPKASGRAEHHGRVVSQLKEVEILRGRVPFLSSTELREVVSIVLDDIEKNLTQEKHQLSSSTPNPTTERKARRFAGHSRYLLSKIKEIFR
jgi:hypothetical protein